MCELGEGWRGGEAEGVTAWEGVTGGFIRRRTGPRAQRGTPCGLIAPLCPPPPSLTFNVVNQEAALCELNQNSE